MFWCVNLQPIMHAKQLEESSAFKDQRIKWGQQATGCYRAWHACSSVHPSWAAPPLDLDGHDLTGGFQFTQRLGGSTLGEPKIVGEASQCSNPMGAHGDADQLTDCLVLGTIQFRADGGWHDPSGQIEGAAKLRIAAGGRELPGIAACLGGGVGRTPRPTAMTLRPLRLLVGSECFNLAARQRSVFSHHRMDAVQ